jgi:hypothetical protein
MTLTLPTRSRPAPARTRRSSPAPHFVEVPTALPVSRLDRVLRNLARDHGQHAEGRIFPCPLCFDPALRMAR